MLNATELGRLAVELDAALERARVQGVHGPGPERVVIELYAKGQRCHLLIALERPFPRAHLVATRPPNPPRPFPLIEVLRRELKGAALAALEALPGERVLRLRFEGKRDEDRVERRLYVELFPASRNLVLTDGEEKVLTALRSGRGGLRVGAPYARPERPGNAPTATNPPFAFLDPPPEPGLLSQALESWATPREEAALHDTLVSELTGALRRRLKKERRLLENLEADLTKAERFAERRQKAELIRQNLHRLREKTRTALVTAFTEEGEREVEIELDPRATPKENMERLFGEARRLERALPRLAERRHRSQERCEQLEALQGRVDSASTAEEWQALEEEGRRRGLLSAPAEASAARSATPARAAARLPYRRFVSADDLEILVGRTSSDNDTLTFKVARGNDWWLHADGFPGSHVVVRNPGLRELPEQTLLDAALLAAHYSKAPAGAHCGVSWTQRKYVSKFRGAHAGQVQLARRKTLRMRHDPERLARLVSGTPPT